METISEKQQLTEEEKKKLRESRFGKQSPPREQHHRDRSDYKKNSYRRDNQRRHRSRSRSGSKERKRSYGDHRRNWSPKREERQQRQKRTKTPKMRAEERVRNVKKLLSDTEIKTFLDVGCGDATITVEVGKIYNVEKMYGCDVFPVSEFKAIECSNFTYYQVVENKIPLEDGAIDLVSCFVSIHHFDNFPAMAREINRVIKPGGYLFIREHDCDPSNTKLVEYLDDMHKKFPDHQGDTYYWSKVNLRKVLEENGYEFLGEDTYTGYNPQQIYHSLFKKK